MKTKQKYLIIMAALALVAGLTVAGCGGGSKKSGSDTAVSSTALAKYTKELNETYKGTYEPPSGEPVKPPPGKNIWVITTGQSIESSQKFTEAIEEASSKIGWNVQIFDGKFESSRELTGIQEAIAAKADGIILYVVDCSAVRSGMEQAKAAGIPVVTVESKACQPPLATYELQWRKGQSFQEWIQGEWAADQAKWVIGKTKGEAKTIVTVETDIWGGRLPKPAIEKVFAKCSTCEVVDWVTFVGSEFGPPLQQKIEQALNSNPDANSFIAAYDAVLTGGGAAAALRGSGRLNEIDVMGGEGSIPAIELIHDESGNDACTGNDFTVLGYGALDAMIRVLVGQDPSKTDTGAGTQVCDAEHNLPAAGHHFEAPIDYPKYYEEMWGLR